MTDEQILDKIQKLLRDGVDTADILIDIAAVIEHRQPRGWKRIFKP